MNTGKWRQSLTTAGISLAGIAGYWGFRFAVYYLVGEAGFTSVEYRSLPVVICLAIPIGYGLAYALARLSVSRVPGYVLGSFSVLAALFMLGAGWGGELKGLVVAGVENIAWIAGILIGARRGSR